MPRLRVTRNSATGAAAGGISGGVVAATDPYFAQTRLLLHMNGSSGSTSFVDSSPAEHAFAAYGNAQISTAQSKFGGASGAFDGAGDYLYLHETNTAFGTGDFTIECWVYLNQLKDQALYDTATLNDYMSGGRTNGFAWYVQSNGKLQLYSNSANCGESATVLSTGQWYHLALTRTGSTWKYFINGQQDATVITRSLTVSSTVLGIGLVTNDPSFYLNGYLDDFRVTAALRYTGNFTPPTEAFPDTNATAGVAWAPSNTATTVWLDAADATTITLNGSAVSQWSDKSGNNFHISQATANQQPAYNATGLNSKGLLTFDGSNDYLFTDAGPASFATLTTFIAVFKYISSASEDIVLGLGKSGDSNRVRAMYRANDGTTQGYAGWGSDLTSSSLSCDVGGSHHIWSVVQNSMSAPQLSLWRDGALDSGSPRTLSASLQATQTAGFSLGSLKGGLVGNYYSNVSVAEVLVFYTAISASKRQRCEGYLAHKWGLTASLPSDHPYKAAAPTIP